MLLPQPSNEAERLATLHSLAILDAPSTPAIDRICRIAQQLFDVPMVHMTFAVPIATSLRQSQRE